MPKLLPKKVKTLTSSLFSMCQLRDHVRQAHIHLVQAQRHSKEINATPLNGVGCWADSGRCVQVENAIFGFTRPRKREKMIKITCRQS